MYAVRVRACAYGKANVRGFALEGNTVEQGDWCLFLGALVSREGGSICNLKRHVCLRRLSHLVGRSGKGRLTLTLFLQMEPSVVRVCCHALARIEGGAAAFETMRWKHPLAPYPDSSIAFQSVLLDADSLYRI